MRRELLLLILLTTLGSHAEDWTTTKTTCKDGIHAKSFHTLEECAIDLFTLNPVGPTMGNIGTGSGFGAGAHAVYATGANHILTFKGLYSINSSYIASGQYRMVFRPIHTITLKGKNGHPGQTDDTKANVDFNVVRMDLRTQDFYGIGPNSTLAGHAVYRQQETWTGMNGYTPITYLGGVLGVLGEVKYLRPAAKGVSGDAFPSVNVLYGAAGAPASTSQADFIELGAGLSLRTPTTRPLLWEKHDAQVMYRHYFEQGGGPFSFDRLDAWSDVSLDVLKRGHSNGRWSSVDFSRPWWKDVLCMQTATGSCSIGSVTFAGKVTASYTSAGSSVPFYLQPTLGGADFDGADTLRGLVDYRLRAPNRLLMQVDFDKPIAQIGVKGHPLGQYGLYTFFDAGNVALTPGQLISNGMRKDAGVGFSIAVQNKIVLRAYIAFGAGEGSHPNVKMLNSF